MQNPLAEKEKPMTNYTKEQIKFREWLNKEIELAKQEAVESNKIAMNSYGAGLDYGIYNGLLQVRSYFTGELE